MDAFTALADPTRRRIVERLGDSRRSVGELVEELGVPQPTVSKHLRTLREAGFVSREVAAQSRIYRLEPRPFQELERWLEPYARLWTDHLDALERHLDDNPEEP